MISKDPKIYELGINYVLKMIKGKWKPNILCGLSIRSFRYNELLDGLNHSFNNRISQKVLTSQLKELEADGMITRNEIKASHPKIVSYSLTDKGRKVASVLKEFSKFGEELAKDNVDIEIQYKFGSNLDM